MKFTHLTPEQNNWSSGTINSTLSTFWAYEVELTDFNESDPFLPFSQYIYKSQITYSLDISAGELI